MSVNSYALGIFAEVFLPWGFFFVINMLILK